MIITRTPNTVSPYGDFNKIEADSVLTDKGYDVIYEMALQCPCKSESINQLSNCKNCGGSGYAFINPRKAKVLMHSMNLNTKFKEWSEEKIGNVSVTCINEEEISYMDRLTLDNATSIHNECLQIKSITISGNLKRYFFTTYNIVDIIYIGAYIDFNIQYRKLILGVDYIINKNIIEIINSTLNISSITIKYKFNPQYHIIDIPRNVFVSNFKTNNTQINLPIHAVARLAHYVLNRQNINNDLILSNDTPN